jgi:hypothetical protein
MLIARPSANGSPQARIAKNFSPPTFPIVRADRIMSRIQAIIIQMESMVVLPKYEAARHTQFPDNLEFERLDQP